MFPLACTMLRNNKIDADQEHQAMEQFVVGVFYVRGVCGRAGVRVRTRQCACLCSVPADLEARPRDPPWQTDTLHALPQIALPNPYHQEGAPRRFME